MIAKRMYKYPALALAIVAIMIATYLHVYYFGFPDIVKPVPLNIHAVVVTIDNDSNNHNRLIAYDCQSASYAIGRFSKGKVFYKGFIASLSFFATNKKQPSALDRDLDHYNREGETFYASDFYVLLRDGKAYSIRCYNQAGNRKSCISLAVKNSIENADNQSTTIQITKSWIAISQINERPKVYLFNRKGELVRVFQNAGRPQFMSDGSCMAYVKRNVIDIYDLEEMRVRSSVRSDIWPADIRFAPDGKSIILLQMIRRTLECYYRAYAVDIRERSSKLHKLPITIKDPSEWTVLNKIPSSFKPVSN